MSVDEITRPSGASASAPGPGAPGAPRSRAARWLRGPEADPRWARPALVALLVVTAALYLWGLGASGYANSFYSAAVQAGSQSWEAFFFGSSDAGNSITVDKPPASLWLMALSVRVFGLSSWSVLVPQALLGVGTVWLLHATTKRRFGAAAGLLAGLVLALTPVAALMFRFNNPDALLVLLMVGAAAAVLRAVEGGRTRWLLLAGALVGLGFLTKQLQVFLVLPALGLTYLLFGPVRLVRRVVQLLAAGVAIVLAAGWWVAVVELLPSGSRPYVGGSQDDSFLGLTFGYNGFGRLTGQETGSVGGGGGTTGTGMWGQTGVTRLFGSEFGGQVMWLVPAALVMAVAALVVLRRRPRSDGARASVVLWLTWLVVTGATFSLMSGIFHAYYTVALAPAVAGLVATSAVVLWRARASALSVVALAVSSALTAVWGFVLLERSATSAAWSGPLAWVVLVGGLLAAVGLAAAAVRPSLARGAAAVAVAAALVGPAAYTVDTVATPHTGSIVSAGPAVAGTMGGPGGGRAGGAGGGGRGQFGQARTGQGFAPGGTAPGGTAPGGFAPGATGTTGRAGGTGGMGGLLSATTPSAELQAALEQDASSYTWVAATVGSNNAAGYQLATQEPVMPIGGFNGTDPSPTLAQFQQYVASGQIHWFIASGLSGRGASATGTATEITAWVEANYTATTIGGTTVYDLTTGTAST